jgi:hypothetical protein
MREVQAIVGDGLTMVYDCVGVLMESQHSVQSSPSNSKRGALAVLVLVGTVDESNIRPKHAGYDRKFVACAMRMFRRYRCPFWGPVANLDGEERCVANDLASC